MRVFDHNNDDGLLFGRANLKRYALGGVTPIMVVDVARDIRKPVDGGQSMKRHVDVDAGGVTYTGLSAPFTLPDFGPALVRCFPTAASVAVDHLLQPGGGRDTAPVDSFVPGDNDMWSIAR